MKGEVVSLRVVYNEDLSINCYELVIDCIEKPNIKLGKCKIEQ